jgi:hypothetical protein
MQDLGSPSTSKLDGRNTAVGPVRASAQVCRCLTSPARLGHCHGSSQARLRGCIGFHTFRVRSRSLIAHRSSCEGCMSGDSKWRQKRAYAGYQRSEIPREWGSAPSDSGRNVFLPRLANVSPAEFKRLCCPNRASCRFGGLSISRRRLAMILACSSVGTITTE